MMQLTKGTKFNKIESCLFWLSRASLDRKYLPFVCGKIRELCYYVPEENKYLSLFRINDQLIRMYMKHFKDVHDYSSFINNLILFDLDSHSYRNRLYGVNEFSKDSAEYMEHVYSKFISRLLITQMRESDGNGGHIDLYKYEVEHDDFRSMLIDWLYEINPNKLLEEVREICLEDE
jgi:hypothetical protein